MTALLTPQTHSYVCPAPQHAETQGMGLHRMHYVEWGDKDASKTAVCVHGMTRNARDFDYLACELVRLGYRVLAVDIVGRGRSDWLTFPQFYGYPLYVADMIAFCNQVCLSDITWIGTSMGGLIGMMVEASTPHFIDRLVLNDIGPFIPKAALQRIGGYIGRHTAFDTLPEAEAHFRAIHAPFGVKEDAHWKHLLQFSIERKDDGKWHFRYDPAIGDAFWTKSGKQRKLPDLDVWAMWNIIETPTLVVRGTESDLLLKDTANKMAGRKGVDLLEFEGVGHAPMLMEEAQISAVTGWLHQ